MVFRTSENTVLQETFRSEESEIITEPVAKIDRFQALKEAPENLFIGFLGLGASALEAVKRRGIQFAGGGIFPDEMVRRLFEPVTPTERPATGGIRFPSRFDPFADTTPNLPGATAAEAFALTTRLPDIGATILREKAAERQEKLPEVTLKTAPFTRLLRPVLQSGVPSLAAAIGVSILTGDVVTGLILLGETEGGAAFEAQIEAGGSIRKAIILGDLSEAAEIGGEMLVFPKLFRGLSKGIPFRQALLLIAENAGQEGVTGFTQRFLEIFGIRTTEGVSKTEAAKEAFDEGIKAIPENAFVGGVTAGGASLVSSLTSRPTTEDVVTPEPVAEAVAPIPEVEPTRPVVTPEAPKPSEAIVEPVAAKEAKVPTVPPTAKEPAKVEIRPPEQTTTEKTSQIQSKVAETVQTDFTKATSAKQASLAEDRKSMGLDEINSPDRKSWGQSLRQAQKEKIPAKANRLAEEVNANPRPLNDVETAGVTIRMAELKNEHAEAMEAVAKSKDDAEIKTLSAEVDRIEAEFDALTKAVNVSGTEKGRALAAQKLTINKDFDLISVLNRAKTAAGKKLTAIQNKLFKGLTEKLSKTTKRVEALEIEVNGLKARGAVRIGNRRFKTMNLQQKNRSLDSLVAKAKTLLEQGCNN